MFEAKVGDEVGYGRYHTWGTLLQHGFSRVARINHHGHIHLENGKVFDRHGHERKVEFGGLRLMEATHLRAALQSIAEQRARNTAARELQALLDARGDRHAISDETRAKMIELVNRL